MNRELILIEIKALLISYLGLPLEPGVIADDEPLLGNRIHVTSLVAIEILTALEDRFDVQFPDEIINLGLFASVRRLGDAVAALLLDTDSPQVQDHVRDWKQSAE